MDIDITEVPFRTSVTGRPLLARVYAPRGALTGVRSTIPGAGINHFS
jgi:hypothetical protein